LVGKDTIFAKMRKMCISAFFLEGLRTTKKNTIFAMAFCLGKLGEIKAFAKCGSC
jgi:hypothetical protein